VTGFASSYLLSFPNSRVVAGATREDAAGYDGRVTAAGVHAVLDSALRLAPGLAQASLSELRVGFRPLSADGKPVLGACSAFPNLYFATGHGGYGLEVGPYSGALVAGLVLGHAPAVDLTPFSVERFRAGGPPT
jgi:D-amino-acid dehydrogenase